MGCITGKNGYYSEEEVKEALIRSQIRFLRSAVNYYLCNDCSEYHLTSQGQTHSILTDASIQSRIKRERQAQEWTGKLGRR